MKQRRHFIDFVLDEEGKFYSEKGNFQNNGKLKIPHSQGNLEILLNRVQISGFLIISFGFFVNFF